MATHSKVVHVLRLVAVRSGALRTQRQELSGIFALPLELLQEVSCTDAHLHTSLIFLLSQIETCLFDVTYVKFHPCRNILDDHVEKRGVQYVPECTRLTKKTITQSKKQSEAKVEADLK